jgi:hypothetical protein
VVGFTTGSRGVPGKRKLVIREQQQQDDDSGVQNSNFGPYTDFRDLLFSLQANIWVSSQIRK